MDVCLLSSVSCRIGRTANHTEICALIRLLALIIQSREV